MRLKYLLKNKTCKASLVINLSSCPLNARDLRQHRLSPNLESNTIQPIHEPLPKTGWSEDATSSKVKIIL